MPDLATLTGKPSGHAPATGRRHRSDEVGAGDVGAGAAGVGGAGGSGRGGGGGGGGGAAALGLGAVMPISLRRCNAVQTANAAPLIIASRNSRFSHVVIGA